MCPPYRLPTQTTCSGQGRRGVSAFLSSLSIRSSHAPSFLSCGLCVIWQRTVSAGGLACPPPPRSHMLYLPAAPLQMPLLRLFLPSSLILQILVATSAAHKQTPSWSLSLELTLCGHPLSYLRPISLADETWLYLCILYAGPQQCDMWCLVFCWLRRRLYSIEWVINLRLCI